MQKLRHKKRPFFRRTIRGKTLKEAEADLDEKKETREKIESHWTDTSPSGSHAATRRAERAVQKAEKASNDAQRRDTKRAALVNRIDEVQTVSSVRNIDEFNRIKIANCSWARVT